MTKRQATIQKEYRKQRNRLNATVNRYNKLGLLVDFVVPDIPKRVTLASVRRLERITFQDIRKKTRGVDYDTGEILSFTQAQRRRKKLKKDPNDEIPFASDIIISNFKANISGFNEYAVVIITNWLNNLITSYGANKTADMLDKAEQQGKLPSYKIAYNNTLLRNGLAEMANLMDLGALEREKLIEATEYDEWFDYLE